MVAFFSLEYAIEDSLPIYAGGLGVLAADLVFEAGSAGFPFTALGLLYTHPRDTLIGDKEMLNAGYDIVNSSDGKPLTIPVEIENRLVDVRVWGKSYGRAKLYLLDPNIAGNLAWDRKICRIVYGPNPRVMFAQQLILGLGGIRLLRRLGINPEVYHLNEGHAAMAILELFREKLDHPSRSSNEADNGNMAKIISSACENKVVATKHTIFTGSGLHLEKKALKSSLALFLRKYQINIDDLFNLGTHLKHLDEFSTTNFLLRFACRQTAVSKAHAKAELKAHPESQLFPITNGVNRLRWQSPELSATAVTKYPDRQLWTIHQRNKEEMFNLLTSGFKVKYGSSPRMDSLVVVWARRLVPYKQPLLLFNDINRLSKIVNRQNTPVQFIVAGSVYISDPESEKIKARIERIINKTAFKDRVIFLPEYDLRLAKILVRGADVWLNTPVAGYEACGTSGMKAGLNGALQLSTKDGWALEVDWENLGWAIKAKNPAGDLYSLLETKIIPLYYHRDNHGLPKSWIGRMRRTIDLVERRFTTTRMLKDYQEKLYLL